MARKRMLDPGVWTDEGFVELSHGARLLWIGLISLADDDGRGIAGAKSLKAEVFPADEISYRQIDAWKTEISQHMRAVFYSSNGREYYSLHRWEQYQYIQARKPSTYPSVNDTLSITERYDNVTIPITERSVTPTLPITEQSVSVPTVEKGGPTLPCNVNGTLTSNELVESVESMKKDIKIGTTYLSEPDGETPAAKRLPTEDFATNASEEEESDQKVDNIVATVHPDDRGLYVTLQAGFLRAFKDETGADFPNYGREGKAIKRLISYAKKCNAENPGAWLKMLTGAFLKLRAGPSDFWRKQPILPSVLSSSGILSRVIQESKLLLETESLDWLERGPTDDHP